MPPPSKAGPAEQAAHTSQSRLPITISALVPISTYRVSLSVLTASEQPAQALKFARYLTAPEKGGVVLGEMKFEAIPGDEWAARPELVFFSGGVNRPAVEGLVKSFAEREGVDVTTVFNGCGVLCAQMQAMEEFPDAYYACDLCFVPPVAEQFPEIVILTQTKIGIAKRRPASTNAGS